MATITERDSALSQLRVKYEKLITKVNDQERMITRLVNEKQQLQEDNTIAVNEVEAVSQQWSGKVDQLSNERDGYAKKLDEIQEKLLESSSKLNSELEVNKVLRDQMQTLVDLNKAIHTSAPPRHSRTNRSNDSNGRGSAENNDRRNNVQNGESDDDEDEDEDGNADNDDDNDDEDEVVILHDSLCKRVNNTLLSREKVTVKKKFAPDIVRMEEALDNIDCNVVVLQAFTRDLSKMTVEEMNQKIAALIEKALTKVNKVVVSLIVRREDVEDIDLKANRVNTFIMHQYLRNDSVVVCDNKKLYDSKFRNNDKLHLSKHGVPVYASNLKYAIAKAVGVTVQEKRWRNGYDRNYDRNSSHEERRWSRSYHGNRRNDYWY